MFDGWLNYGGVEIANHARLTAYIAEGLIPPGWTQTTECTPCPSLASSLGDEPYSNPSLDEPPWYDVERPESLDFAGVMMLGITGLSGTTRQVIVTDRLGDGGIPGKPRRAPRVIGASALLVGSTTASVEAGLSWLTTALAGGCSPTVECGGLDLTAFIDCPPACGITDPDSPMVPVLIQTDDDWFTLNGTWAETFPYTGTFTVVSTGPFIDGGDPETGDDPDEFIDGGGPDDDPDEFLDGGTPGDSGAGGSGLLAGPVVMAVYDEVAVTWHVGSLDDLASEVTVAIGAVTPDGTILDMGDFITYPAGDNVIEYDATFTGWGDWRPALWVQEPGALVALSIAHRTLLTVEECVAPLRRRYPNVTTVSGPTVVAEFESECGGAKLVQVEWTWTAGDPYRYSEDIDILDAMPSDGSDPEDKAVGVQTGTFGTVTQVDTACLTPTPVQVCGVNLCCTTDLPAPPSPPTVANCFERPVEYVRSYASLPSSVVPNANAVLSFTITNDDEPKTGVRIRVHPNDDPDLTIDDECAFIYEATIEFMPANAILTIDNVTHTYSMVCDPEEPAANAETVLLGAYDGPLAGAVVGCDRGYIVTVDTPTEYPADCAGQYDEGDPQGDLTWSMVLTPREG